MSLIIATGSNLGKPQENLACAKHELINKFGPCKESRVYRSMAVDGTDQPIYFNQVLEFSIPKLAPKDTLKTILNIENKMGEN